MVSDNLPAAHLFQYIRYFARLSTTSSSGSFSIFATIMRKWRRSAFFGSFDPYKETSLHQPVISINSPLLAPHTFRQR
jgi:hypothetical protein